MPAGAGHSLLVQLLLADSIATFYQDLRWPGWQAEAAALAEGQGIAVYPFLFTPKAATWLIRAAAPPPSPNCSRCTPRWSSKWPHTARYEVRVQVQDD
jgi:hypothetical protein